MGLIYAEIDLINSEDIAMARRHVIGEEEIRRMPIKVLVDTGTEYLCINEATQEQLGLPFRERRKFQLADGSISECDIVGPVDIRFKNRMCATTAIVLPGDNEMLLGAINLEDMDVIIHPQRRELVVNPAHPYVAQMKLKNKKMLPEVSASADNDELVFFKRT